METSHKPSNSKMQTMTLGSNILATVHVANQIGRHVTVPSIVEETLPVTGDGNVRQFKFVIPISVVLIDLTDTCSTESKKCHAYLCS